VAELKKVHIELGLILRADSWPSIKHCVDTNNNLLILSKLQEQER